MQQSLADWIGRTETTRAFLDPAHAARIALTLGGIAPSAGAPLPPLWQWAYFNGSVPTDALAADGHPPLGGFLPPAGERNRMWAGGEVQFHAPLLVGRDATKTSTVVGVREKEGRSGSLLFVTVEHAYVQDGAKVIIERQDIVYKSPGKPRTDGNEPAPSAHWSREILPTPPLLFRYSAVTFNSHRIHYDHPYATLVEGYPGLVVHGPLIATLMLQAFCDEHPNKRVTTMRYRGLRPLICEQGFSVGGALEGDGEAQLWAESGRMLAHQAEVQYA
jgi:itaconyl-CoA hydratase/mesaconyl-C4 CoA hydratase